MTHQFEYKGIHYSVTVYERATGRWTWSFQIGGGAVCKCADFSMDREEIARSEVMRKVKWQIDHKKWLKPIL
ncbi:hypothetical protein [Collimonas pratensis]|uniref:DUF1508 domain-containing protein n=1 Tax=Collimonas pratensis TaxID=279113 RepID=A0A127Q2K0_9BURK|nr:hypothetical protein [Collimonas pratensis]AMP04310.1 hypothetical protein CPter91_1938 [Collimonas pratensis]